MKESDGDLLPSSWYRLLGRSICKFTYSCLNSSILNLCSLHRFTLMKPYNKLLGIRTHSDVWTRSAEPSKVQCVRMVWYPSNQLIHLTKNPKNHVKFYLSGMIIEKLNSQLGEHCQLRGLDGYNVRNSATIWLNYPYRYTEIGSLVHSTQYTVPHLFLRN